MPSRPLNADRSAVVKLQTRLDVEAMAVTTGKTDVPAAVVRLVQLVPPARVDLVDEVLSRVGRRDLGRDLDWLPAAELPVGPGEMVDVVRYRDKLGYDRRVYRLLRHGVFICECKTPEELARHIDLAELVEDNDGVTKR